MSKKKNDKAKKKAPVGAKVSPAEVEKRPVKVMAGVFFFTAVASIIYGIVFFASDLLVWDAEVGVFTGFRAAQLLGGIMIIITATVTGVELIRRTDNALLYGLLTGGALLFAGLSNLYFGIANGVFAGVSVAAVVEWITIAYCLIFGLYAVNFAWNNREQYLEPPAQANIPVKKKKL